MKGKGEGMNHQCYRDRLDSVGRSVRFCVGTELPGDSKIDFPNGVAAGIFGPQAGEPLVHQTDGVRYCFRCDGITDGCNTAIAVAGTEDLEVGDRILGMAKEGVNGEGVTVRDPECPMRILLLGVLSMTRKLIFVLVKLSFWNILAILAIYAYISKMVS